jgi:hypothetical protein
MSLSFNDSQLKGRSVIGILTSLALSMNLRVVTYLQPHISQLFIKTVVGCLLLLLFELHIARLKSLLWHSDVMMNHVQIQRAEEPAGEALPDQTVRGRGDVQVLPGREIPIHDHP